MGLRAVEGGAEQFLVALRFTAITSAAKCASKHGLVRQLADDAAAQNQHALGVSHDALQFVERITLRLKQIGLASPVY